MLDELPLERALRTATEHLSAMGVGFALIGGLAVSVRAEPRFTRDADLAVAVTDDEQAEGLIAGAIASGFVLDTLVEQSALDRLATARLRHPSTPGVITDLLFASSGIEPEVVAAADTIDITSNMRLPVATAGHLIALKLLARDDRHRPADADDLRALALVADSTDWATARSAVGLIEQRGYNRGRDLVAALAKFEAHGAY